MDLRHISSHPTSSHILSDPTSCQIFNQAFDPSADVAVEHPVNEEVNGTGIDIELGQRELKAAFIAVVLLQAHVHDTAGMWL